MRDAEIAAFAKRELERIDNPYGGPAYRCAAYLVDGVYLPCVLIASADTITDLAIRRFEETFEDARRPEGDRRFGGGARYRDIVQSFVAVGNRVASYDITRLEQSRYAIPVARLAEIRGETRMSWTQFAAVMRDGRKFYFGTTFSTEFFQMPEGYGPEDIARIIPHDSGEGQLFRERPFFTCYIKGL